jgi:hypothetical protein
MAGVVKRHGYQHSSPYSSPNALNVRCDSVESGALEGRERGGTRPGLARAFSELLGGGAPVRMLTTVNFVASSNIQTRVCAIASGELYRENASFQMALADTTGGVFNPDRLIHSSERNQVLYIADHSLVTAESSSTYQPKKYDPAADDITNWTASDGTIPYGCDNICTWRDRLVLAGGTTTPHGLYMSRQSDPEDWDYSETDSGAAVSLTLADAGQVGDVVTCLSPHSDNCLVIGCRSTLWILRGDPGFGGQLDNLSQHLGVIDKGAWCVTPENLFVFLSQDGLYMVPAGCDVSRYPQSLSRERLPRELLAVNRSTTNVAMAYDVVDRGIHIFLTPITAPGSASTHWWFDWESKSFWKVQLASENHEPFAIHSRMGGYTSSDSYVLLGCRDGRIRHFKQSQETDDSDPFTSYVFLGPFGDPTLYADVRLDELMLTLAADSGDVNWEIRTGSSPEAAFAATAGWSGTFTIAGRNYPINPRARGQSLYIKLSNGETGVAWAFEGGYLVLTKGGKTRL